LGPDLAAYLPLRLPRLVAALAAGTMLGGAGFLVQRLTGNPLAGPEVLGIGAGAGVGLAATLTLFAAPGIVVLTAGSAAGAGAALAVIVWLASRPGFGPERLLLGGIALG
ncbi:iron chelate uptake ABC transporter family permease subunit, partial [Mycobacterium tuberculosis]|nr:iron chelate uptake ABC transporter family permease subunit [Mycobacterium tuberculosis]